MYEELLKACEQAVAYMQMHGDPHSAIIITQDFVKVVRDEMGAPISHKENGAAG